MKSKTVLPFPSSLSTQMRPPCASTIFLQIARPKPVPLRLNFALPSTWTVEFEHVRQAVLAEYHAGILDGNNHPDDSSLRALTSMASPLR
jgi:hypothetical protein